MRPPRPVPVLVLLALTLGAAGLGAVPAGAAPGLQLQLSLDSGESFVTGSQVVDTSGRAHHGTVLSAQDGALMPVPGWSGTTAARYPSPCSGPSCPKAVIEVPSSADLRLGTAPFEWGTRLRLDATATSAGENLVQKGLAGAPAGQWKLQVDGFAGRPSCVVSGSRPDGSAQRVTVLSDVSVADGAWHQVLCRRTATGVGLLVDGRQRAFKRMVPVRLVGDAPVHVGGKRIDQTDSDQFFGTLDDVTVRRL